MVGLSRATVASTEIALNATAPRGGATARAASGRASGWGGHRLAVRALCVYKTCTVQYHRPPHKMRLQRKPNTRNKNSSAGRISAGDSHPVDLCIRCAPEAVASRRARGAPLLPGAWQRGSHARVRLRAHVPSATPSRRAHRALEPRRAAASMRGGALGGGGARRCRARLGLRPCGVRPAGARSAHGARRALSSPLHRDCVLT